MSLCCGDTKGKVLPEDDKDDDNGENPGKNTYPEVPGERGWGKEPHCKKTKQADKQKQQAVYNPKNRSRRRFFV